MIRAACVAALTAALVLAAVAGAQAQSGARWVSLSPSPIPRQESKGVQIGDSLYTYGGFASGLFPSPEVERYEVGGDRWSVRGAAPVGLSHMGVVVHDGKLYSVGGYIGDFDTFSNSRGVTVARFMEYDPERDAWRELPPAPTRRGAVAAGVIGDELYVAGGFTDPQQDLALLEIYDFRTGKWRRGPDMEVARDHAAGAVVGGRFYVIGGRPLSLYGDLADVERFDPVTGRWERTTDLPLARSSSSAVTVGDRIVVIGGENGQQVTGRVDALDTRTGRWSRLPDMKTPREATAAAVHGARVFVMEGTPTAHVGSSNVVEALDLSPLVPPARPRLRLRVSPGRVTSGARIRFRFRVTAPRGGSVSPVAGATVRFAGARLRTDGSGRAVLTRRLGAARRHPANATAAGFLPGRSSVRAVRR